MPSVAQGKSCGLGKAWALIRLRRLRYLLAELGLPIFALAVPLTMGTRRIRGLSAGVRGLAGRASRSTPQELNREIPGQESSHEDLN